MKTPSALAALLLALLLAAPGGARPQEKDKAQEDLQKKANEFRKHVKEIRGLDFKSEVKVGVYTKQELVDFIKGEFERELPREKAGKYQRAYAHFGLMPKDLDLFDALIDLFGSSIAGFYHPKTKEMRLIRSGGGAMNLEEDLTLVHELNHAAQDQNYDLTTMPLEDETNDDMIMAIKGLIEGDASVVGYQYAFKDTFDRMISFINSSFKKGQLPGKAGKLPKYLRLTLTFPYGHGTEFVMAIKKAGNDDFAAVSKAFEDLPSSTEQILHPKKYHEERDYPQVLKFPDLVKELGEGYKLLVDNVHGEFVMRIVLGEFKTDELTTKVIEEACEGWDGDRYVVVEKGDQVSSAWMSTWDSEDDAKQFFDAYRKALNKKHPEIMEKPADDRVILKKGDVNISLERRGRDVLVMEGAQALVDKADWLWKETKRSELKKVERVQPKDEKKKKDYR